MSDSQFTVLLFLTMMTTAVLYVTSITVQDAKQSAWIVPLLASGPGFFSLWLIVKLGRRFPEKDLIQYSTVIAGKIIGKIIGIGYIFYFFVSGFLIIQQFTEILFLFFLGNTPTWFVGLCFLLVCSYGVLLGIEVIARSAQFVLPLFVVSLMSIAFFSFRDMHLEELLPLFEGGLGAVVKASFVPGSWFGECIILAFLLPYINKRKEIFRKGSWAIIAAAIFFTGNILLTLLILGPELSASYDLPFWLMIRFIEVGRTFLRIETFIIFLWIAGAIVKLTLAYYLGCTVVAEVFGWRSRQWIVILFGSALFAASTFFLNNAVELNLVLSKYWPPFAYVFQLVIPGLLLGAAYLFKKGRKTR
ncbi:MULTISPECIES: endospore germination permease [Desulfitobacterium]|uniref:GerAB/ArcD/ProY family transporter n=1 Tax=Desulfitobacterium TaxID=36853 RepID=UPI0021107C74|nr:MULTISPECIES: endospore germination permease [Desulfitobacterium]